jgi:hypothetical protein
MLRSTARARYLPFIDKEFPHLSGRYRATYANDHYPSKEYSERLREVMTGLCEKHGVVYGRWGRTSRAMSQLIEERFSGDPAQLEFGL